MISRRCIRNDCTLETYVMLFTSVSPTQLIKIKRKKKKEQLCLRGHSVPERSQRRPQATLLRAGLPHPAPSGRPLSLFFQSAKPAAPLPSPPAGVPGGAAVDANPGCDVVRGPGESFLGSLCLSFPVFEKRVTSLGWAVNLAQRSSVSSHPPISAAAPQLTPFAHSHAAFLPTSLAVSLGWRVSFPLVVDGPDLTLIAQTKTKQP